MVSTRAPQRPRRRRAAAYGFARWMRRRVLPSDAFVLTSLIVLLVVLGYLDVAWPQWVPVTTVIVPMLVGGFLCRMRDLRRLYLGVAAVILVAGVLRVKGMISPGEIAVVAFTGVIVLVMARMRSRLGVQGNFGESMLVDLRDRLSAQGTMPALP